MSTSYYVIINNQLQGPLTIKQLKLGLSSGKITRSDMATVDKSTWVPLGEVEGIGEPEIVEEVEEVAEASPQQQQPGMHPQQQQPGMYPQQQPNHTSNNAPVVRPRKKLVVIMLGILFPIGVHRFYLGFPGYGMIMAVLLLPTFGLSSIWCIIDMMIIVNSDDFVDAQGNLLE